MTSTVDPLLALRNAIVAGSPIKYATADGTPTDSLLSATHLVLPSRSFPKSTPTRYKRPASDEVYSLEAIYLAWLLRDEPGADYMKHAREAGLLVGFVSVTERKNVVQWLEGKVEEANAEKIIPLVAERSSTPSATPPKSVIPLPSTPSNGRTPAAPAMGGDVASSTVKRRYVPDSTDVEVVKKIKANEVELRDRNTVLRGIKANNFNNVRVIYAEKLKKLKEASRSGASSSSAALTTDPKLLARKAKNLFPIIIISSSPTALLTMYNVKRFLQESHFEPTKEVREKTQGKPEDLIAIYRVLPTTGATQRYFVVDSVEALSKFGNDAWERVVCVMTTGQAWQFRPYKWPEPRTLFHHVKGIYMTWTNDPPNPKIKDWNVTELKIDPHRRHVDKSVVAHFWKILDTWIATNKPWLIKS